VYAWCRAISRRYRSLRNTLAHHRGLRRSGGAFPEKTVVRLAAASGSDGIARADSERARAVESHTAPPCSSTAPSRSACSGEAARHGARLTIIALVHHPLAAETGLRRVHHRRARSKRTTRARLGRLGSSSRSGHRRPRSARYGFSADLSLSSNRALSRSARNSVHIPTPPLAFRSSNDPSSLRRARPTRPEARRLARPPLCPSSEAPSPHWALLWRGHSHTSQGHELLLQRCLVIPIANCCLRCFRRPLYRDRPPRRASARSCASSASSIASAPAGEMDNGWLANVIRPR